MSLNQEECIDKIALFNHKMGSSNQSITDHLKDCSHCMEKDQKYHHFIDQIEMRVPQYLQSESDQEEIHQKVQSVIDYLRESRGETWRKRMDRVHKSVKLAHREIFHIIFSMQMAKIYALSIALGLILRALT